MKIYTKTGDRGETGLYSGERVSKTDQRIEAIGTLDELNAILGIVRALASQTNSPENKELSEIITQIQNQLFNLGAMLATNPDSPQFANIPQISATDIDRIEALIDAFSDNAKPLREFILPGSNLLGAHLDHARTVCRRAERRVLALEQIIGINQPNENSTEKLIGLTLPEPLKIYLNRLSDLIFTLERWVHAKAQVKEQKWQK